MRVLYKELNSNEIKNPFKPTQKMIESKKEFYKELEESILSVGIKNPIMTLTARYINTKRKSHYYNFFGDWIAIPETEQVEANYHFCRWGCSRLFIAQKHNLIIPCIIHDFANIFKDDQNCPEVSIDNIQTFFKDKIIKMNIGKHGFDCFT